MGDTNELLNEIKAKNESSLRTITDVVANTYVGKISLAFNAGAVVLLEYILYAVSLCVVIFIFVMEKITPFHIFRQMRESDSVHELMNVHEITNLIFTSKIILGLLALFIFICAYLLRKNRKYKSNIQYSIGSLKEVESNLTDNIKQITDIQVATDKVLEAAVHVANEAKL